MLKPASGIAAASLKIGGIVAIILATCSLSVIAAEDAVTKVDPQDSNNLDIFSTILAYFIGLIAVGYIAATDFGIEKVSVFSVPMLPRYMVSSRSYALGKFLYFSIYVIIYSVIMFFYKDVSNLVKQTGKVSSDILNLSGAIPTAIGAVLIITALKNLKFTEYDIPKSIFLSVREWIQHRVRIPDQAKNIAEQISSDDLNIFTVPQDSRALVANDSDTDQVFIDDFDADVRTIDYQWSVSSFLYIKARDLEQISPFKTFLTSDSSSWDSLKQQYKGFASRVKLAKDGKKSHQESTISNDLDSASVNIITPEAPDHIRSENQLIREIRNYREKLAVLLACLNLYGVSNEINRRNRLKSLGIRQDRIYFKMTNDPLARIIFFILIFAFTGPFFAWASCKFLALLAPYTLKTAGYDISGYDLLNHPIESFFYGKDGPKEGTRKYLVSSGIIAAIYILPIFFVFIIKRYWRDFWPVPQNNLINKEYRYDIYLIIFFITCILSFTPLFIG